MICNISKMCGVGQVKQSTKTELTEDELGLGWITTTYVAILFFSAFEYDLTPQFVST